MIPLVMNAMDRSSDDSRPTKSRKRRIPKACGSCRHSKVKCDGQRPCSRCHALKKVCHFEEAPKDAQERKIESLERELDSLRGRLSLASVPRQNCTGTDGSMASRIDSFSSEPTPPSHRSASSWFPSHNPLQTTSPVFDSPHLQPTTESPSNTFASIPTAKRTRSHFEVQPINTPDFVTMGLITADEAETYFTTFFQGCHQYVPIFDPQFDSLESIRGRSAILFSTICATGCRILRGSDSQQWHLLDFHLKRVLNATIGMSEKSLEAIQALLVRACYVSERSLLVTLATRLAIDTGLPEAYEDMTARYAPLSGSTRPPSADDASLMRRTRTWLHLLNLVYILHVDASDLLSIRFRGDVRRCRVLLESPLSTDLDLHLISQVELNVLRAGSHAALSNNFSLSDDEVMDIIKDAKIDIDVWFHDWIRIFERTPARKSWLSQQLRIQQCWADAMTLCRSVRVSGIENVEAMSIMQRDILVMAKNALKKHLHIIIEEPREYLRNLRFAMDFVWAKCAFCFLLLLKLSMLIGDEDEQANRGLVQHGRTLLAELSASSSTGHGGRSSTSRVYLQLLQTGIEKFSRTVLNENITPPGLSAPGTGAATPRQRQGQGDGEHNELESFVPEQFIFEWDFPGLTLFSSPTTGTGWLDEFLRSALAGGDELFGVGWNSTEPGD